MRFKSADRQRLAAALEAAREARVYRRLEALLLVAAGHSVAEAARRCRVDRSSVHRWLARYRVRHEARAHTAHRTHALAARLRIRFLGLPKQASELSLMDQLWRELKRLIAANRQAASIDALAADAAGWVLALTPRQARRKAGMASKRFWRKNLLRHFWPPT
jgi:hypothetical protein